MAQIQKDMTVGSPARLILNFSLPVMAGNMFQQLYSMTDTIIVGKGIGTGALAAVGSTGTISFLILGFTWGICSGFIVPVGQQFGAKNEAGVRRACGNAVMLSLVFSALLTALSCGAMHFLLDIMNTPEDIYDMAYGYILVICGGLTAIVLYNLFSTMLRAIGDSRDPLIFLVLSTILNIVLDLVFVMVLHAGVAGAAWATVLSQAAAAAAEFLYILFRVPELHFAPRDMIPDGKFVREELRIGIPMGFQFSITAIGTLVLQSSLNTFGSTYIAAYTTGTRIEQLMEQLFSGIGATMASYCAQNTGAGRYDRIQKGIHAADIQGGIAAVASGILCMTVGSRMTVLFVSDRVEEMIPLTSLYLNCTGLFMIPLAAIYIYRSSLQGMGYSIVPLLAGVVELSARTLAGIIAADRMSYFGICMANPAAWLSAAAYLIISYVVLGNIRKKKAARSAG